MRPAAWPKREPCRTPEPALSGRAGTLGFAVLLALLCCTACGSHPESLLLPVAAPDGTARVSMLAATTRAPSGERGSLFGGDRGDGLALTKIVVSIPPHREKGTVQWPSAVPGNPAADFVATSVEPLAPDQLRSWFRTAGGGSGRVFVFVHGFNTPFPRAVFRFAQLVHDSGAHAAPVLFSWPSRGRLLDYKRDLDNASYSRSDLAVLLETAAASPSVREIVILAHSMGAWVATEALRQIGLEKGGVPGKITNVVLASPDLDIGLFRRQVEEMGRGRPRITIFVARNDRALNLSRIVAGGDTRLGAIDATREEYQARLAGLAGITVLDLTSLRAGDRINHDQFAASPEAVRLIGDRLIENQVITDSDLPPILAAADALGSAAGLVIAAPIQAAETAVNTSR